MLPGENLKLFKQAISTSLGYCFIEKYRPVLFYEYTSRHS